jgi:glycosyltransferase involved in cell wall biosynthesis
MNDIEKNINKPQLIFACQWQQNKSRTWSGTPIGLETALAQWFDIIDLDLQEASLVHKVKDRICNKGKPDFQIGEINRYRKQEKKHIETLTNQTKTNAPIFQFTEYFIKEPSFIYLDLSVSFVEYFAKTNQDLFQLSGFDQLSASTIHKRKIIQDLYFQSASGIFTMSHWLRDFLLTNTTLSPSKIHVVGGGINTNKNVISNHLKQHKRFLFVGRDFKRKGGPLVLRAFSILQKKNPELELYIIGPQINSNFEKPENCFFIGDVTYETVAYYFNLCDVFVMPSYFEAYGLAFVEALAFGLPCIGRNVFEMPYFIQHGETGFLLEKDDPSQLAEYMLLALNVSKVTHNVEERKNYYLSEYSWENVGSKIAKVILSKQEG